MPETPHFIHDLTIERLWGERDFFIRFKPDVNILIGPNASGKTTILNVLRYSLVPEVGSLRDLDFGSIRITLKRFSDGATTNLSVQRTNNGLKFVIGRQEFTVDIEPTSRFSRMTATSRKLASSLHGLVPAVWLPVSRRLPIPDEVDEELLIAHTLQHGGDFRRVTRLESVDHRLRELCQDLVKYRLSLGARLALRYKDFEKRVLEVMLYDKRHDRIGVLSSVRDSEMPKAEEKELLIRSFQEAGLLDAKMRARIDQHFDAAAEVVSRLAKSKADVTIDDITILPLIPRTRAMVEAARELERSKKVLFAPLRRYESLISSFFGNKTLSVTEAGELQVTMGDTRSVSAEKLSSGEKQLLILLTQALLRVDSPVVYVADEPELSLHISWQEKLLASLAELGGKIQLIVATHSPDIIGPYREHIINLATMS